jgi:O-antigen ligase
LRELVAIGVVVIPWLWPWTGGPSVSVWPWLASLSSAAALICIGLHPNRVVAVGWVLAAITSAAIGIAQFTGTASGLGFWVHDAPGGEVFANLRQRNQFATLTNVGLASLLVTWMQAGSENPNGVCTGERLCGHLRWEGLGVMLLATALLVAGNVLSKSRTGLAQLVLVCLLILWWYRGTFARALGAGLLAMYAALGIVLAQGRTPAILERMTADLGCSSRKVLWSNVLDLIAQKPWFGWGWGELDYAHYAHLYGGERFCAILDNAHNLPLHLAVELGVPVALLLCGVALWAVLRARPWRETEPARQLAWAVLALIGLHSMLEYPLWYGPFAMAVVLCIAMLWRSEPLPGSVYESNRRFVHVWRSFIAIIIIAFIAYVGWDYARISQLYLAPEDRSATYREDTLAKVSGSWLFRSQVEFAELTLTPLTRDNAANQHAMALRLLHYSPEPRVIEKVVESAVLLGRDDQALWQLARYRAAFPEEHAQWVAANAKPGVVPVPTR